MFRQKTLLGLAVLTLGLFGLGASTKPAPVAGNWVVDARHSDAQLVTDGTTDYGKTKIDVTVGFARVNGTVKFNNDDPSQSKVDLHIYPATSMAETIEEDGKFRNRWLANLANNTILCFHSKKTALTADGKLQATGELTVTRVDRNVELTPNEGYYGPVYGPPIIHRVSREATFVFDLPDGQGKTLQASASSTVYREQFPALLKTVLSTYWPPVVQDRSCEQQAGLPSQDYSGAKCTGTFLQGPSLPEDPGTHIGEDYPGNNQNFSKEVGKRLDIMVHMRLQPRGAGDQVAGN